MNQRSTLRTIGAVALLYAVALAGGFALLCLAFKAGVLASIDILFYRGLVLVGLAGAATFALLVVALGRLRSSRIGPRDAFAATAMSLSFNLAFLVVLPVTVDRSISLFMLGHMARAEQGMSADEMRRLFTQVYVGERHQIDRRLREQAVSGFLERNGDTYRISAKGRFVVDVSRIVADLFDSHAGLLDADPAPADLAQRSDPRTAQPSRPE